ncbi:MAG: hypothetical protein KAQ90_07675, partial [Melioribacteraceae bacterium]|nr:hypothetical protein [Melioribacteraceae bacterium]
MNKLVRKNLHSTETYEECINRIDKLTGETQPLWGNMDAAQMLSHCAEVQEVANGKDLIGTPFIIKLFGGLVKKMVLNEKPYPKNAGTHTQYMQTTGRDFETEKKHLLEAMEQSVKMDKEELEAIVHPLFGKMSVE